MNKLITWFKAKLLLLSILLVWLTLLIFTWRGWYQIIITLVSLVIPKLKEYNYHLWIVQDQDVNVIFGGNPDVTISSKVGYMKLQGSETAAAMAVVIDKIFKIAVNQDNHCIASIEHDEEHISNRDNK